MWELNRYKSCSKISSLVSCAELTMLGEKKRGKRIVREVKWERAELKKQQREDAFRDDSASPSGRSGLNRRTSCHLEQER